MSFGTSTSIDGAAGLPASGLTFTVSPSLVNRPDVDGSCATIEAAVERHQPEPALPNVAHSVQLKVEVAKNGGRARPHRCAIRDSRPSRAALCWSVASADSVPIVCP